MADSYQVLARRMRPKCFADVVGQDLFVTLIAQAFRQKKLAAGFLLTGMWGIGKTTLARLLAKTLNCAQPEDAGKTIEPCGACDSCLNFEKEAHPDILEIDAASHTGVEDVRRLIEASAYQPLKGKYRVFIIDEVHMLSKSAFNALLKTLEAPPAHVKFIFATTESHKIPTTILSRCLCFDLKRIPEDVIVGHLKMLTQRENKKASDEALKLVASSAEGSLRTALSLLEQALLMTENELGVAEVRQLLGIKDPAHLQDIMKLTLGSDQQGAIELARRLYQEGGDPLALLDQLARLVHAIVCVQMKVGQGDKFIQEVASSQDLAVLGRMWQMCLKGREEILSSPFPQEAFEMILVRLAYATQLPTPSALLEVVPQGSPETEEATSLSAEQKKKFPHEVVNVREVSEGGAPALSAAEASGLDTLSLHSLEDVLDLLRAHREVLLLSYLTRHAELKSLKPGHLELWVDRPMDTESEKKLAGFLHDQTKSKWIVQVHVKEAVRSSFVQGQERQGRHEQLLREKPVFQALEKKLGGYKMLLTPLEEGAHPRSSERGQYVEEKS